MKKRQMKFIGEWWHTTDGKHYGLYYVEEYDSPALDGAVLIETTKDGNICEYYFDGENFRVELDQYLWGNFKIDFLHFVVNEEILKNFELGKSYGEYICDADNVHKEYDFDIIYKKMKERHQSEK